MAIGIELIRVGLMDKIRDIIYDSIDYIIMAVIVIIVIGVLGWRLDVLFAKDVTISGPPGQVIVDNSGREEDEPDQAEEEPEGSQEDPELAEEDPEVDQDIEELPQQEPLERPSPVVVRVEIPEGSMPGRIGIILEEKGVVSSSREFIAKAVELGLDTKLKSGVYSIQLGLPIEDIVRILTN